MLVLLFAGGSVNGVGQGGRGGRVDIGLSREAIDEFAEAAGRLRLTRSALGLSIEDLCRATGTNSNTYSTWEMGIWWPSVSSAKTLRNVLGYTLDWIYAGDRTGLPLKLALAIADYEQFNELAQAVDEVDPCANIDRGVLRQALARRTEWLLLEEYDHRQAMREIERQAESGGLVTVATHLEYDSPEDFARYLWVENSGGIFK